MANPDASREAAHRRYEKAAEIASNAGSSTQAGLNEAYRQLYQNADWTPEEGWADDYQEGPAAWLPSPIPQYTYQNNIPSAGSYQVAPDDGFINQMQDQSVVVDDSRLSPIDQIMEDQRIDRLRDRSLNPAIQQMVQKTQEFNDQYQGSPQQLADLERAFQEEQERELGKFQNASENQLYSQYAITGSDPYNDPLFMQQLDQIGSIDEIPSMQSDLNRRLTDGDGNFEFNPLNWNLLGFTSQNKTPKAARDLYDFHFNQEDREREGNRQESISEGPGASVNKGFWDKEILDPYAVDNGADPKSREALFMTGEQYLKYRTEFGLPGRSIDEINPNEIYSKQDEQDRYGFIPYITSDESLQKFHDDAAPHALSNIFNHLADLRRENTDFDINFDDKTFSGHDLIKKGNLWWNRNVGKEYEEITDPSKVDENSVPYTYVLTDANGNEFVAKSALVNDYLDEQGRPVMQFEDGEVWTFDDEDDVRNSLGTRVSQDGDFTAFWKNIEPLVLSDGTVLRADRAVELLDDNNYENYVDYGRFNWNNPYIEDPFLDKEGKFNLNPAENSFIPWMADVSLGSLPYFFRPTAAAQGLGNAVASYTGFQPGYQDFLNGTYSLLSDNPTREQQVSATLGSLALPITEHLWGNIGGNLISKPLMRALGKNEADIAPLIRYGMGTVGEGLEEIPGNAVEQFQGGSGFSGWYADQMYRDADGNLTTEDTGVKAYDNQGNPVLNRDTNLIGRLHNFFDDIPLAFIGGATMGGTLGAPRIKQYFDQYNQRKDERDEFGDNMLRPDFNSDLLVGLTDDERDYYNR